MQMTTLDDTGKRISVIGFGAMSLSIQGRPDRHDAKRVLHTALDGGITFIDTADSYCLDETERHHNEKLIAEVLAERPDRHEIAVATKGGIMRPGGAWTRNGSPVHLRSACEGSLRALGVDRIFLYQLHAPDPDIPFTESVGALASLQREGKIEFVGLSNVTVAQIRLAREIVDVVSVQNRLSPYFRESIEAGVVAECVQNGLTLLAYSPVGGSRLAKKIARFEILRRIASVHGVTPHQVALAWVRAQGKSVVPIPGASRIPSASSSAAAHSLHLASDEVLAISTAHFPRD